MTVSEYISALILPPWYSARLNRKTQLIIFSIIRFSYE